jgi:hypothetical protein
MTAEIAIMNRSAVVLAADSATTVTSWNDGQPEQRYFKGANKLFELSRHSPVGLMIYGSAALQGVPWELVIKSFREDLGDKKHDSLKGYADHFFDYVQNNDRLFSEDARLQSLTDLVGGAGYRLQSLVSERLGVKDEDYAGINEGEFSKALQEITNYVDAMSLPSPLIEADLKGAIAKIGDVYRDAVGEHLPIFKLGPPGLLKEAQRFAHLLVTFALKEFRNYVGLTGIVVAGYGKMDFYPALEVFQCFGFLGDRLIFERADKESKAMDPTSEAVIQPFATTSMIETFRFGVGPDIIDGVVESTQATLETFAQSVIAECKNHSGVDADRLKELVANAADGHMDKWVGQMRDRHFRPLSKVIHSLPIPDMAGLAKSLIELESLKERVTRPSESVSGPIDVAVISKHDGFVWLERKHYFHPELNPRFFNRGNYV